MRRGKTAETLLKEVIKCYAHKITLQIKRSADGDTAAIQQSLEDVEGQILTLSELYEAEHGYPPEESKVIQLATQLVVSKTGRSPQELIKILSDSKALRSTPKRSDSRTLRPIYSTSKVDLDGETLPEIESVESVEAAATTVLSSVDDSKYEAKHTKFDVARKCKEDFEYFCRTCLEIPYRPGLNQQAPAGGYGPLVPNDAQMKIIAPLIDMWIDGKPVRAIILKSRQMGITTILLAFWMWLIIQKNHFTVMFIIDKDAHMMEKRELLLRWAKNISERVPELPAVSSQGSKVIRWSNYSKILFESSQSPNPGTSEMINALHCSEKPKWVRGKDVVIDRSILPGIPDERNTFVIDESTADGVNGFLRKWIRTTSGKEEGTTKTIPIFLPWHLSPEYKKKAPNFFTFSNNDPELSEFDEEGRLLYNEQQYAEKYLLDNDQVYWRRLKIKNDFKGDIEAFDKEYPTTPAHAWRSSGSIYFGSDTLVNIEKHIVEPVFTGKIVDITGNNDPSRLYSFTMYKPALVNDRNGYLKLYELPETGVEYVIGGDVAEGIEADPQKGGDPDYTCFVVCRKDTGKVVALLRDRVKPEDAALPLLLLAVLYNGARVNCERNSVGQTVWAMFKQTGYGRIYVRQGSGPYDDRAWNKTTSANRDSLLLQLRYFVRRNPEKVPCRDILEEMQTFAKNKDGKPEALPGNHDDTIFAFAHAYHMIFDDVGVRVEVVESVEKAPEWDTIDGLFEANGIEISWGEVSDGS